MRNLLLEILPDVIFIAGDSTDPNGTHSMCVDAFHAALASLREYSKTDDQRKFTEKMKAGKFPFLFHYRGAWQEFSIDEADAVEVFSAGAMQEKIAMILEHVSQLDPLFPGPVDDRQFWERARDRNMEFVESSRQLGLRLNGDMAEVYRIARDTTDRIN